METELEGLCRKASLTPAERQVLDEARIIVADHVERHLAMLGGAEAQTQTRATRKLTAKDLFSEAERILYRTGGGMTLHERLQRDQWLRSELM